MKLEDYKDLETADAKIDYSKLDQKFWDSVYEVITKNNVLFEQTIKKTRPTWADMHRKFDF